MRHAEPDNWATCERCGNSVWIPDGKCGFCGAPFTRPIAPKPRLGSRLDPLALGCLLAGAYALAAAAIVIRPMTRPGIGDFVFVTGVFCFVGGGPFLLGFCVSCVPRGRVWWIACGIVLAVLSLLTFALAADRHNPDPFSAALSELGLIVFGVPTAGAALGLAVGYLARGRGATILLAAAPLAAILALAIAAPTLSHQSGPTCPTGPVFVAPVATAVPPPLVPIGGTNTVCVRLAPGAAARTPDNRHFLTVTVVSGHVTATFTRATPVGQKATPQRTATIGAGEVAALGPGAMAEGGEGDAATLRNDGKTEADIVVVSG